MHKLVTTALMWAVIAPWATISVAAEPDAALQQLRQDMAALRADYEARLQRLEQRLQAAEAVRAASVLSAPAPVLALPAMTAPTSAVSAPAPALPLSAAPPLNVNAFNPAMSLILSGTYLHRSRLKGSAGVSGFRLPADADIGPGERGFNLGETELGLAASVDPAWRGATSLALHGDNSVSVEEAWVQTTALGGGVSIKLGRALSGIGTLNAQHAHTWDFIDNPLAYQALLGTQVRDDGLQLRWLAPLDQYLELGAELGRGLGFPAGNNSRNGAGQWALMGHTGGDVGDSHSWRAGLSVLNARAADLALQAQRASDSSVIDSFTGRTRVWVVDAVWKWAPNGNATRTNFKLQGEWLRSTRQGRLTASEAADGPTAPTTTAAATGWYLQGIYQFMPGWRVGLRSERLVPAAFDAAALGVGGLRPSKQTLVLEHNASEFSRLRLQIAQDRSRWGAAETQIGLQYQMSLGAHAAHGF